MRVRRLLVVTTEDAFNVKAWSGIPYSLRRALEGVVEVVVTFMPPRPKRAPLDVLRRVMFGAKDYPLWITKATLRQAGRAVAAEIERVKPDAVLSISSQCVVYLHEYLKTRIPVFLFSDAPYLAFVETYKQWETSPKRIGTFGKEEAAAGRKIQGLCFGSEWACAEAARLYELDAAGRDKLHVTPLGANWKPPVGHDEIFRRIEERIGRVEQEGIELLYLGKDWERKGGPLAVEVARGLRAAGVKVKLHVVGCRPNLAAADTGPEGFVEVHGALYQTDAAESAKLAELFLRSYFMVVPTLAECFGIVFAEAQAFGLPPVSRRVHALPTIVVDGETGLLLGTEEGPEAYVGRMLELIRDAEAYRRMARRARERYEAKLTWERTAEGIVAAMEGVPEGAGAGSGSSWSHAE